MNTLKVEAPYGYYVIRYDVVPRSVEGKPPFAVGGKSLPGVPMGLFGEVTEHSTFFPDTGTIDNIPVDTHVQISSKLNTAATAELPEDKRILERCGSYLFVTKDPGTFERLESIVASWTVDSGSADGREEQPPKRRVQSEPGEEEDATDG